ncbi:MAG: sigma-70 family RNA polymerase sigma factor [bacterium]|nr:sigma-70 family RNA polymerase sigma factor [bacterium]
MRKENIPGFWGLWIQQSETLYFKCLNLMGGDEDEAKDALGAAMLHAREKLTLHAGRIENLNGWLYRLTVNICIDRLRKRKKQSILNDKTEAVIAGNKQYDFNFSESSEDQYQREEAVKKVLEIMKRLPPRLFDVAILHYFDGMPYPDISMHLKITNVNVRKRIQKARSFLGRELREALGDVPLPTHLGKKKNGLSHIWSEIDKEVEKILKRQAPELSAIFAASHNVTVTLPSGINREIPVFLRSRPLQLETRAKTLEKYIARYPRGWKKRKELAEILYALGHWDQAAKQLHLVLTQYPQSLHSWLLLGQILLQRAQEEKAVGIYKAAIPYVHNKSSKYYLSGMMALSDRRPETAAETFVKAAALEPGNAIHLQSLALAHMQTDHTVEAMNACEAALDINPKDLFSLTHSHQLLTAAGRLEKAEQYVERVLTLYPKDIPALEQKVELRCRRGLVWGPEGKETQRMIRQLKQSAPPSTTTHEAETLYRSCRGKWDKAIQTLRELKDIHNDTPAYGVLYSRWLFRCGKYRDAATEMLKVLDLQKTDIAIHLETCEILAQTGLTQLLKTFVRELPENFPNQWRAFSTAGLLRASRFNEIEAAVELTCHALRLQPLLPEPYINHGRVLHRAGKHSRALKYLGKAWQLLPKSDSCIHTPDCARLLAQCCKAMELHTAARKWFQKSVAESRRLKLFRPAEAGLMEGKALIALGEQQKGTAVLLNVLACNIFYPHRQEVYNILNRCRTTGANKK